MPRCCSPFPSQTLSLPRVRGRPTVRVRGVVAAAPMATTLITLTRPDDWHLHLRDGDLLQSVLPHSAEQFGRAIVMPNLKPPVTTTAKALEYPKSILKSLPIGSDFDPLMTLYLTDNTNPEEIKAARSSGAVYAVKLYPAGATTNSQDGVTDIFGKCLPVLEEMVKQNMPLLVHGEVTDSSVDTFDRENVFIETILAPLVKEITELKNRNGAHYCIGCGRIHRIMPNRQYSSNSYSPTYAPK